MGGQLPPKYVFISKAELSTLEGTFSPESLIVRVEGVVSEPRKCLGPVRVQFCQHPLESPFPALQKSDVLVTL